MGLKLSKALPVAASTSAGNGDVHSRRARKRRFTTADLPLPRGGQQLQMWRKHFIPSLISWAGSCEDPFGTNGHMDVAAPKIWKRIYPDAPLGDQDKDILLSVVRRLSGDSGQYILIVV
jgi:hypothetical protein